MTRFCRCPDYKRIIDALNGEQDAITLDSTYFLFCPWCGDRLVAPCVVCEKDSDESTGKTLYWSEEINFCSPGCVMQFDAKQRGN